MKNILTIAILSLLIISCGQNASNSIDEIVAESNPEALKTKRNELKKIQQQNATDLKKIEDELAKHSADAKNPLVTSFTTATVEFKHHLEIQGNVVTKQNILIFPEHAGLLTNVYVKEGQKVIRGQELAKIDDGGLSQQLLQLEAQTALAKTTYERQKRLWEQKIGSEIQYLQAETSYTAQKNATEQMKVMLSKTIVRAPFSGVIDDVLTEQGTVVAPGQSQLMRIVNLDNMYIEAEVPENNLRNIKKGKSVEVFFPVLGKTILTKVRQVGNYINPSNRSFKIEIGIPNKDGEIKPNLTSRLKINDYTNENAILIPQSIITENANGEQYVYTITDKNGDKGTAKREIIETGKTQGDFIEVLSGIKVGDEIIEEGARNVNEGQIVKVLTK
ncbi:MAG: efflux transporter periplasmic adaptor subunit [Bacteroidetes bacterium MedPE-SWsnd-G1]|nr:MAG: efflux transporter periplasmic adaptor subunit [Bacteroidetes bacterium MedPE-SWsnd-G1]